jgi:hypothetical protein
MQTRPERDSQHTAQCVYSIPCACGRNRETSSRTASKHGHNLREGLLGKKLSQYDYDDGHRVSWDKVRILEIESNSRYRKYKESAHMTCLTNPVSQSSLDISPI